MSLRPRSASTGVDGPHHNQEPDPDHRTGHRIAEGGGAHEAARQPARLLGHGQKGCHRHDRQQEGRERAHEERVAGEDDQALGRRRRIRLHAMPPRTRAGKAKPRSTGRAQAAVAAGARQPRKGTERA